MPWKLELVKPPELKLKPPPKDVVLDGGELFEKAPLSVAADVEDPPKTKGEKPEVVVGAGAARLGIEFPDGAAGGMDFSGTTDVAETAGVGTGFGAGAGAARVKDGVAPATAKGAVFNTGEGFEGDALGDALEVVGGGCLNAEPTSDTVSDLENTTRLFISAAWAT